MKLRYEFKGMAYPDDDDDAKPFPVMLRCEGEEGKPLKVTSIRMLNQCAEVQS